MLNNDTPMFPGSELESFVLSEDKARGYYKPYILAFDEGYVPPTPEDIKTFRNLMAWTQVDMAKIAGVAYTLKPSRSSTVGKWESTPESKEHRAIPYAAWRLLLITAGIV